MADPPSAVTAFAVFSAIGGSIVGSVLGGCISYFLQRKNLQVAKAQRDEDGHETRKALGYSLLFKMIMVVSDLETLRKSLRGCLDEAQKRGGEWRPWQVVLPVANVPSDINFSPDEMALILSLDDKVFNQIAALDELHNSTSTLFTVYASKRTAMTENFGAERMEGMTGTASLTRAEFERMVPRAAELDGIIDAMLVRTGRTAERQKQPL